MKKIVYLNTSGEKLTLCNKINFQGAEDYFLVKEEDYDPEIFRIKEFEYRNITEIFINSSNQAIPIYNLEKGVGYVKIPTEYLEIE